MNESVYFELLNWNNRSLYSYEDIAMNDEIIIERNVKNTSPEANRNFYFSDYCNYWLTVSHRKFDWISITEFYLPDQLEKSAQNYKVNWNRIEGLYTSLPVSANI